MDNRCVCCGEIIPEGRQVCPNCEKGNEKLIELLGETVADCLPIECLDDIACHLMANGVTPDNQVSSSKWIPVTERLPESLDDVLVWYEYRGYNGNGGLSKHKIKEYGIGCYITSLGCWAKDPGIGTDARVIAWMPLPEPPKGE